MSDITSGDTSALSDQVAGEADVEPRTNVALRTVGEIILGIALGALILWVLVVSVNDIQFVYQGF